MIEARYSLQGSIGLGQFADIFSPLSSGERNLNRAWATLLTNIGQKPCQLWAELPYRLSVPTIR